LLIGLACTFVDVSRPNFAHDHIPSVSSLLHLRQPCLTLQMPDSAQPGVSVQPARPHSLLGVQTSSSQ